MLCGCATVKGKNYSTLGVHHFGEGNYKKAVKSFEKAVENDPKNTGHLAMLGWTYFKLGDYDKAISTFEQLAWVDPYALDAYTGRGWSYFKKLNYDRAVDHFEEAIDVDPDAADPYDGIGWCSFNRGDLEKAEKYFNIALRKGMECRKVAVNEPDTKTSRDLLKFFKMPKGKGTSGLIYRPVEALAGAVPKVYVAIILREGVEHRKVTLAKTDPEAHRGLGYVNYSKGNYEKALVHCKTAALLVPAWNDARVKWGDCLFALKKHGKAAKVYKRALEYARTAEIYDKIGWSYLYEGDKSRYPMFRSQHYKRARRMFKKALAVYPEYASSLTGLSTLETKVPAKKSKEKKSKEEIK